MAEFKIKVGVELDDSGIKGKLESLGEDIELKLNTNKIESQLKSLKKSFKDTFKLDSNIMNDLNKIAKALDKVNKIGLLGEGGSGGGGKSSVSKLISDYKELYNTAEKLQKQMAKGGLGDEGLKRTQDQINEITKQMNKLKNEMTDSELANLDFFESKKSLNSLSTLNGYLNKVESQISSVKNAMSEIDTDFLKDSSKSELDKVANTIEEIRASLKGDIELEIDVGSALDELKKANERIKEFQNESKQNAKDYEKLFGQLEKSSIKEQNDEMTKLVSKYKELGNMYSNLQKQMAGGLDREGLDRTLSQVSELETEMKQLYDRMDDKAKGKVDLFNASQSNKSLVDMNNYLNKIESTVTELQGKIKGDLFGDVESDRLNLISSKLEEIQTKAREGIDLDFKDIGDIVNDLDKISTEIGDFEKQIKDYGNLFNQLEKISLKQHDDEMAKLVNEYKELGNVYSSLQKQMASGLDSDSLDRTLSQISELQSEMKQLYDKMDDGAREKVDLFNATQSNKSLADMNSYLNKIESTVEGLQNKVKGVSFENVDAGKLDLISSKLEEIQAKAREGIDLDFKDVGDIINDLNKISSEINDFEKEIKDYENLFSQLEKISLKQHSDEMAKLSNEYKELGNIYSNLQKQMASGLDEGSLDRTLSQIIELQSEMKQLYDKMDTETRGKADLFNATQSNKSLVDMNNYLNKIESTIEGLQGRIANLSFDNMDTGKIDLISSKLEEIQKKAREGIELDFKDIGDIFNDLSKVSSGLDDFEKEIKDYERTIKDYENLFDQLDKNSAKQHSDEMAKLSNEYKELSNIYSSLQKQMASGLDSDSLSRTLSQVAELESEIKQLYDRMDTGSREKIDLFNSSQANKSIADMNNYLNKIESTIEGLENKIGNMSFEDMDVSALARIYEELEKIQTKAKEGIELNFKDIGDIFNDLDKVSSKLNDFEKISKEHENLLKQQRQASEKQQSEEMARLVNEYKELSNVYSNLQKQMATGLGEDSLDRTLSQMDELESKMKQLYDRMDAGSKEKIELFNESQSNKALADMNNYLNKIESTATDLQNKIKSISFEHIDASKIDLITAKLEEFQAKAREGVELDFKDIGSIVNDLEKLSNVINDLAKVENLANSFERISSSIAEAGGDVEKFQNTIKDLENSATKLDGTFDKAFNNANNSLKEMTSEARSFQNSTKKIGSGLLGTWDDFKGNFAQFTLAELTGDFLADGIRTVARGLRDTIVETDSAITDLNKVYEKGLSGKNLDNYLNQVTEVAKSTGKSSVDVIQGTAKAIQSGIDDIDQALVYAKQSAMLSNVGDIDQGQADNMLTSVMSAYGGVENALKPVREQVQGMGKDYSTLTKFMDLAKISLVVE